MLVVINFTNFEVIEDQFNVLGGDYLTGSEIMEALQKYAERLGFI